MCESNPPHPPGLRRNKKIISPLGIMKDGIINDGETYYRRKSKQHQLYSSNDYTNGCSCGDVESQGIITRTPSPLSSMSIMRRPQSQSQQRRRKRPGTNKKSSLPLPSVLIYNKTTRTATASAATTSTTGSPSSSSSWKELAHKIVTAILTDLDDETLQNEDTEMILVIITLLKEAMLGILIAFIAVSLVLFLDHRFLLNLPTARNFRHATYQLINDHDTLRNLEENTNLKLMEQEDFSTMMQEIANAANKTKLAQGIFDTRSQDMIQMTKEGVEYGEMLRQLLKKSGLDTFCPDCTWSTRGPPRNRGRGGGGRKTIITCQERLDALQSQKQRQRHNQGTVSLSKYQAMTSVMKKYSCRTHSPNDLLNSDLGSFHQVSKENALLQDWDASKRNFNPNGLYHDGLMTCFQRIMYLNERYSIDLDRAGAMVMVEEPHCTLSYYNDNGGGGGFLNTNTNNHHHIDDGTNSNVHKEKVKEKGVHGKSGRRGDDKQKKIMAGGELKDIHSSKNNDNNKANNNEVNVKINNHHSIGNEKKLDNREMKSKLMPFFVDKHNGHDKSQRALLQDIARGDAKQKKIMAVGEFKGVHSSKNNSND